MANFCSNCGEKVSQTNKFCTHCGHQIDQKDGTAKGEKTAPKQEERKRKQPVKPPPEALEAQKKIKQAGLSAQVMGWILLTLVPLRYAFTSDLDNYAWLASYLILLAPLGTYMVLSGMYIVANGRRTKLNLWLNLLLTVPFLGGVIPVLVIANHIFALSSVKKLRKLGAKRVYHAPSPTALGLRLGIIIAILAFGTAGIYMNVDRFYSGRASSAISSTSVPWSSSLYNYSIKFPTYPETDDTPLDIEGYSIPASYAGTTDSSGSYYVAVFDYSVIPGEFDVNKGLEGGINGMAENGGSVISSELTTLHGNPGIVAELTVVDDGTEYNAHVKAIMNQKRMYVITTLGYSKDYFDKFYSTFEFT